MVWRWLSVLLFLIPFALATTAAATATATSAATSAADDVPPPSPSGDPPPLPPADPLDASAQPPPLLPPAPADATDVDAGADGDGDGDAKATLADGRRVKKVVTTTTYGPLLGGSLGAVGGALGAGIGAMLLATDALLLVPELVLLVAVVSTPALAALVAGLIVITMVVPNPTIDDFGDVVACSAVGCAGTWLVLLLGAGAGFGGAGCSPGSCGDPCSGLSGCNFGPCDNGGVRAASGKSKHSSDIGIPAAAGAGIGALAGLLVGITAGYFAEGADELRANSNHQRAGAGFGLVMGGLVGGAIGGAIVGYDVDTL